MKMKYFFLMVMISVSLVCFCSVAEADILGSEEYTQVTMNHLQDADCPSPANGKISLQIYEGWNSPPSVYEATTKAVNKVLQECAPNIKFQIFNNSITPIVTFTMPSMPNASAQNYLALGWLAVGACLHNVKCPDPSSVQYCVTEEGDEEEKKCSLNFLNTLPKNTQAIDKIFTNETTVPSPYDPHTGQTLTGQTLVRGEPVTTPEPSSSGVWSTKKITLEYTCELSDSEYCSVSFQTNNSISSND